MESNPLAENEKRGLFSQTFYTLRHRDFRLFWIALTISLLGVSFQSVAQGWLVYRLTGSATMLGVAAFIPILFAGPASIAGGLLADRVSRRNLVILTQFLMILPPIILAILIWTQRIQVWHVIVSTSVLAVIAAVDLPSRTSMVPELVPQDELLNAQGLASAVGQMARIAGPALAGLMIAWWGEAVPYFINGVTYFAMVIALLMMKPQPPPQRDSDSRKGLPSGLLGGVWYTLKTPLVLGLLMIAAVQGLFLNSYVTLLPVFASDIFVVGPKGLGTLNTFAGIGALVGALAVANLQKGHRGQILNFISYLVPVALVAFAWAGNFLFSLPLLFLLGFGTVIIRTITATFLLTIVPDEVRGRVISLATLIYFGTPYVGSLPVGYFAEHINAPTVLSTAGILFFGTMVLINFLMPKIRHQE